MARFQIPGIDSMRSGNKKLYSALKSIEQAINRYSDQGNLDPTSTAPGAPHPISQISVKESGGIHDIQITDNSPAYSGIRYAAEYSQTSDFSNYHTIDLGMSQNHRANLGSGEYFWRGYSYYHPAAPSIPVFHGGSQPISVGSGAYPGPVMQPRQGFTGIYRNSLVPPIRK